MLLMSNQMIERAVVSGLKRTGMMCACRVEQLQASLASQAAKQASLEEQLAETSERLAMEDGNKVGMPNEMN